MKSFKVAIFISLGLACTVFFVVGCSSELSGIIFDKGEGLKVVLW